MAALAIRNFTRQHRKLVWLGALAMVVLVTAGMILRTGSGDFRYMKAEVRQGDIAATWSTPGQTLPTLRPALLPSSCWLAALAS